MNLGQMAAERAAAGRPVRAGLIGAGKFGSMFLSQVPTIEGLEVAAIADLDPDRARRACRAVGWDEARIDAVTFLDDGLGIAEVEAVDVVIEATGHPPAGLANAIAAIEAGKHVVMVNVEADVLAGPALERRARAAGVVYSLAYGDQPALVCEMVDWARACGFHIAAAGKGTGYMPHYHQATPETIWDHYELTAEEARAAGMNPKMFTSFVDGTKSAIEMAAIANACDLDVPAKGLSFPPCSVDDLAKVLRPSGVGGMLEGPGMVEVVSAVDRHGEVVPNNLRWGVYVVLEAPNDYAAACFPQYGLPTDETGRYAAMTKPFHLIGLELSISVLAAALRGEATGRTRGFRGEPVAVAKKPLKAGEMLDGEGGYTVWGRLMPAADSLAKGALPIGLAHGLALKRDIPQGDLITAADVDLDESSLEMRLRREVEEEARHRLAAE